MTNGLMGRSVLKENRIVASCQMEKRSGRTSALAFSRTPLNHRTDAVLGFAPPEAPPDFPCSYPCAGALSPASTRRRAGAGSDLGVRPTANANLQLPRLTIRKLNEETARLSWFWPAAYAGNVRFQILGTEELSLGFQPLTVASIQRDGGDHHVDVPALDPNRYFFRVTLSLE